MKTNLTRSFPPGSVKPTLGRRQTVASVSDHSESERHTRRSDMAVPFRVIEVDDRDNQLITAIELRRDALQVIAYSLWKGSLDPDCKSPAMVQALSNQLMTIFKFQMGANPDPSKLLVDKSGVGICDEVVMSNGKVYSFLDDAEVIPAADEDNGT